MCVIWGGGCNMRGVGGFAQVETVFMQAAKAWIHVIHLLLNHFIIIYFHTGLESEVKRLHRGSATVSEDYRREESRVGQISRTDQEICH